jgi:hypothetical protein
MTVLTLKAHFDGKTVTLDEPHDLQPGTPVTVTILPTTSDFEKSDWLQAATDGLALAYCDDEPEYTLQDIKP